MGDVARDIVCACRIPQPKGANMAHGITSSDTMFSVREMPWHGLGAVLDNYPASIDEALAAAGLGWNVHHGDVLIAVDPDTLAADKLAGAIALPNGQVVIPASGWKANLRDDTSDVLGIVGEDYQAVNNLDGFKFLDALIGSDMHFETAGSLWGGRRVWVLARLPEYIELGGDQSATYVFVANSHDGSMAVTAAVTPVRIVCANTLGAALRGTEHGVAAERTYKFRHSGNLDAKYAEARRVLSMTIDYERQFKELADRLATVRMSKQRFEKKVLRPMWPTNDDMTARQVANRDRVVERVLTLWDGKGDDGDTRGSFPGTKWTAYNAVAEYVDYGRVRFKTTNQVARSFDDRAAYKQRALDLVVAA